MKLSFALWVSLLLPIPLAAATPDYTDEVLFSKNIFSEKFDETDFYIPQTDNGPYPVLIFLQGGKVDKKFYSEFSRSLADNGILVAIANHRSILGEGFTSQKVVNTGWDYLLSANSDPSSPLYQKVNPTELYVMGHSFGGTAAHNIAGDRCGFPVCTGNYTRPAALKGVLLYGFHRVGSGIETEIPLRWIQGSLDDLDNAQTSLEEVIGDAKKSITVVEGANHYGINDINNPEGAREEPIDPEISQEESIKIISQSAAEFILMQSQL